MNIEDVKTGQRVQLSAVKTEWDEKDPFLFTVVGPYRKNGHDQVAISGRRGDLYFHHPRMLILEPNENDDEEYVDTRISTDPKITEMFRRLEHFLDDEFQSSLQVIDLKNSETGRIFATFIRPDVLNNLEAALEDAHETISILGNGNALLDLIDAQNEVIMGRVAVDEMETRDPEVSANVDWPFLSNGMSGNAGYLLNAFTADVAAAMKG